MAAKSGNSSTDFFEFMMEDTAVRTFSVTFCFALIVAVTGPFYFIRCPFWVHTFLSKSKMSKDEIRRIFADCALF
jgi:flagellar biosynthesis protein FlhB